jgi:hypothetical protein
MLLGKLQGYDMETGEYTVDGQLSNLPKNPFCVATSLPNDYDDISSNMEYWDKYSEQFINDSIVGFKDWMSLRNIIKSLITAITGDDFANWNNLTQAQKIIAMRYIPTKIIDAKGSNFFMQQAGGLYEGKSYLDYFQTLAEKARTKRLKTMGDFGYYGLGKNQGLQLERIYQELDLDRSYVIRGVLYQSEDNIDGLGDWIMGTNGFGANGLKPLLNAGTYNLLAGFPYTIDEFCSILSSNILENGLY